MDGYIAYVECEAYAGKERVTCTSCDVWNEMAAVREAVSIMRMANTPSKLHRVDSAR